MTIRATNLEPGLVVSVLAGNSWSLQAERDRDDRRDDSDAVELRIKVDRETAIRMAFAVKTYDLYSEHRSHSDQFGAVDSQAMHGGAPYVHDADSAQ